ncbi:MAG: hypothetical protein MI892_16915 [Desulfobacterales bacterium]|nr:hypothetical protein [Desulfobacterales bacterium]
MKRIFVLICFMMLCFSPLCFAGDKATSDAYFDSFTGHKYVKADENVYAEYSKRGEFLKNVPAESTVLTQYEHVYPIRAEDYILYEKSEASNTKQQLLPVNNAHPQGWKAKKLFLAVN